MKYFVTTIITVICVALIWALVYFNQHPCIKSHIGLVHHTALVQFMPAGKVTVPIVYPAHDSNDEICDLRK